MKRETALILVSNLLGFGLATSALLSMTAGVKFEVLIATLVIGSIFFLYILAKQPNWKWRIGFAALLFFQIHSFSRPAIESLFRSSFIGFFMNNEQILSCSWIAPISAGIGLSSFWVVLLTTLRSK